jgi:hypothetical protein
MAHKQKGRIRKNHDMRKKVTNRSDYQNYRTEIPERLLNILAAIFIDANSWKRSFAAYGK